MSWSPTLLLLGLQISTRAFTFILNQLIIRLSNPSTYGAAHIHLELLLGIVLFLSREGIRAAFLRQDDGQKPSKGTSFEGNQSYTSVSLVSIPLGLTLASLALPFFLWSSPELAERPHFKQVVCFYLLSSILELFSEPIYLHALSPRGHHDIALRVRAEGLAAVAKGAATLIAISLLPEDYGLLAFGIGQAFHGASILLTFVTTYCRRYGVQPTARLYQPRRARHRDGATDSISRLAVSLSVQSVFKHLLTEVDKLAVARLESLEDQGGYALGTNYASLPLRLLFQPLEESSRFQFSRDLGSAAERVCEKIPSAIKVQDESQGWAQANAAGSAATESSLELLQGLLHLHTLFGALLLAYLPPLSRPFILAFSGSQWVSTSAPRTLAAYAVFLPVLGWSGILEGFIQSTASQCELKRYNLVILASSATFGGSLWLFRGYRLGTLAITTEEALVYSSALAMMVRGIWGWKYAQAFFPVLEFRSLVPSWPTISAVIAGAAATRAHRGAEFALSLAAYMPLAVTAAVTGIAVVASICVCDRQSLLCSLAAVHGTKK